MTARSLTVLPQAAEPIPDDIHALQREVRRLARARSAVILAHNYQVAEVQDVADYVGDSLGLAQEAARTTAPLLVLCGVYFMAETAKILNMERTVLIPDRSAGCSLADSITLEQLCAWKDAHRDALVVSYVNTTAAIKAESDYCVTSGNAEALINSLPADQPILFLPDMYLGQWLKKRTGRTNLHVWPGECHVHAGIRDAEIRERLGQYPGADLLIHPECGCTSRFVHAQHGAAAGAHVLSTEGMIKHARGSSATTMVVATEVGLLHRLRKEVPGKTYIPADERTICRYMKQITLSGLRDSLRDRQSPVEVAPAIARRARLAIDRMLAVQAS